ncbi:hypothetical protein, partial [Rothia mucilaginosa]|uniref:hypothetical protein n=1 Tax=Rothia mucilaginosa TaxID=43675 RepID=UPI0026F35A46
PFVSFHPSIASSLFIISFRLPRFPADFHRKLIKNSEEKQKIHTLRCGSSECRRLPLAGDHTLVAAEDQIIHIDNPGRNHHCTSLLSDWMILL